jgi:phage terminase large subunit-like protein
VAASPYYIDSERADRAEAFFSQMLRHSKGRWAGQPFALEPWQRDLVRRAFGSMDRRTKRRRYRRVFVFIPRKNGKSTMGAGVANYLLTADGEAGAEVYSAALDREQASIIFSEAKSMCLQEPLLREQCTIYRRAIVVPDTMSSYRVLSADAENKHGLNAHGVIFDELHTQDDRDLYDVLITSTGAREQPMTWMFTTAGFDRASICYEVYDYAKRVLAGEIDDPEFLPVIFEAGPDDDWKDPKTWHKANPNLGVTLELGYMEAECRHAQATPLYENTFRRLHLNQWTQQETRWVSVERWDQNAGPTRALSGRRGWTAMDLSRKTDLTAAVTVFPDDDGTYDILAKFWMPRENVGEKERRDRVPYSAWIRDGLIEATEGNVVDYRSVRHYVLEIGKLHEIVEVAYDPWNATQIAVELQDDGVVVVEHMQGFKSMSEPMKSLEALIIDGKLRHGGNPVLRWMFSNVAVEMDAAENIKPSKRKSRGRIDGIVALVMAIGRATLGGTGGKSVYEERGIRVL